VHGDTPSPHATTYRPRPHPTQQALPEHARARVTEGLVGPQQYAQLGGGEALWRVTQEDENALAHGTTRAWDALYTVDCEECCIADE